MVALPFVGKGYVLRLFALWLSCLHEGGVFAQYNTHVMGSGATSDFQCLGVQDIYILLDHSSSIGTNYEQYVLPFAQDLAGHFSNFDSRYSVIWFGTEAHLALPLTSDYNQVVNTINYMTTNVEHTPQLTDIGAALELISTEGSIFREDRNKVAFILSDGCDNVENQPSTLRKADELKALGLDVFVVYVPSDWEQCPTFLKQLASSPTDKHYIEVTVLPGTESAYEHLVHQDFVDEIVKRSCVAVDEIYPRSVCNATRSTITISGTGFSQLENFDKVACRFTFYDLYRVIEYTELAGVYSDTQLKCRTPVLGKVGGWQVEITRNGLTWTQSTAVLISENCKSLDDPTIDSQAGMMVSSSWAPFKYNYVGETIRFTYTVRNTGVVYIGPVYMDSITRRQYGGGNTASCPPGTLAPNELMTCTGTHIVSNLDMSTGKFVNVATVTATVAGKPVTATDSQTITSNATPTPWPTSPTPWPTPVPPTSRPTPPTWWPTAPPVAPPTWWPTPFPTNSAPTWWPTPNPTFKPYTPPTPWPTRATPPPTFRPPTPYPTWTLPPTNPPNTGIITLPPSPGCPTCPTCQTCETCLPCETPTCPPITCPVCPTMRPTWNTEAPTLDTTNPSRAPTTTTPTNSPSISPTVKEALNETVTPGGVTPPCPDPEECGTFPWWLLWLLLVIAIIELIVIILLLLPFCCKKKDKELEEEEQMMNVQGVQASPPDSPRNYQYDGSQEEKHKYNQRNDDDDNVVHTRFVDNMNEDSSALHDDDDDDDDDETAVQMTYT